MKAESHSHLRQNLVGTNPHVPIPQARLILLGRICSYWCQRKIFKYVLSSRAVVSHLHPCQLIFNVLFLQKSQKLNGKLSNTIWTKRRNESQHIIRRHYIKYFRLCLTFISIGKKGFEAFVAKFWRLYTLLRQPRNLRILEVSSHF